MIPCKLWQRQQLERSQETCRNSELPGSDGGLRMLYLHEARWDECLLAKLRVDRPRDDQGLPWGNRLKRVANRWHIGVARL